MRLTDEEKVVMIHRIMPNYADTSHKYAYIIYVPSQTIVMNEKSNQFYSSHFLPFTE